MKRGLTAFGLSLVLFAAGLGAHEAFHLAVLQALTGRGELIIRPWSFSLLPLTLPSFHAQPATQLNPPQQFLVNIGGPGLAAVPFALLLPYVRDPVPRAALAANLAVLVFFTVIEGADVVLDSVLGSDLGPLASAEFNYGVPLAILVGSAAWAGRWRP